jgi:hypothetical protein
LDWLTEQGQVRGRRLEYSVGFPTKNTALTSAITTIPEQAWTPAITADGEVRDGADVAEVTGLLDLRRWPTGMRVIVRRERPHPGAQLSLLEAAWLRLLALDSDMADTEPKALRFKMLHVPARLIRSSRRRYLRLPGRWPWADQIVEAFRRIMIIPAPT